MRSRPPLATDNRTHQQMGIELNEPRHQIDYNQWNSLQYTSPLIHKTHQQIAYNEPRPIESLTYNEQTQQKMEIAYNEPRPTLSLRYND